MVVTKNLNISAECFFQVLEDSFLHESENQTLKLNASYKKELTNTVSKSVNVTVTITEYDPPHIYKSEIVTNSDVNTILYEVNQVSDNEICVTYTEDFKSKDKSRTLNYKFIMFFMKKRSIKRMNLQLLQIEKIAKREV